jgi:hypothetical protein
VGLFLHRAVHALTGCPVTPLTASGLAWFAGDEMNAALALLVGLGGEVGVENLDLDLRVRVHVATRGNVVGSRPMLLPKECVNRLVMCSIFDLPVVGAVEGDLALARKPCVVVARSALRPSYAHHALPRPVGLEGFRNPTKKCLVGDARCRFGKMLCARVIEIQ